LKVFDISDDDGTIHILYLISNREVWFGSMFLTSLTHLLFNPSGGYPASGYAELDRTLSAPGGGDHHYHGATSPSPAALHSAASQAALDRYGHPQPAQGSYFSPSLCL